jgi:microcystin degradation protein MlrC
MRIAIGGIMHESNTFSPQATGLTRFREGSLTYAAAMVPAWRDAHHEVGGFIDGATTFGYDLVPLGMAWATPSGPVTDEFLDHFCDTLASGIRMAKPDGVLIALHGAMVTPNHPSADTEVLRRLREALGTDVPLAVTLDFHGNVSPAMAEYANILVGYQTYPHIDQRERGLLAARLLTRMVRGEVRAVSRVAKPPMILNLLGQDTGREPMRSLMAQAREIEKRPEVLSVSLMAGFPYADVPDMGPAVIAVTDGDAGQATAVADELAAAMWAVRDELYVPCPEPPAAVTRARESTRSPVLLIDLGDNIGGGSAGDGSVLLAELCRQGATGFVVVLFAPEAVSAAWGVGVGGRFEAEVGGATDQLHGEPVPVRGEVRSLHDGRWVETEARHGGRRDNDQGPTAVIALPNDNTLVLNSLRTPPFSLGQLTSIGIDPTAARIIVVKAAVAYKAAYEPIAGEIIPVDTPGLTAINPARFTYTRIRRPMYPLQ